MGDMECLGMMAIVPCNLGGKIILQLIYSHRSLSPVSGVVVKNLQTDLDVSMIPHTWCSSLVTLVHSVHHCREGGTVSYTGTF